MTDLVMPHVETFKAKARRLGVQYIVPAKRRHPEVANPVIGVCGDCGMELRQMMAVVCKHDVCPCNLNTKPKRA